MATQTSTGLAQALERVFPIGSRVNERGRLEIGGCDVLELAREFGTPAYVVAEDDLRARARAFRRPAAPPARRLRGGLRLEGVPRHGGDGAVRAGGPRLRRRLGGRAAPRAARRLCAARIVHARQRASTTPSCGLALDAGVGQSSSTTPTTSSASSVSAGARRRAAASRCCCASTPACAATPTRRSRPARPTRSSASVDDAPAAIERIARRRGP